ncbi:MAG: hypothetical protein RBT41_08250 [Clostridia bacterium]|jgi:hypothetical protein|nr:hypothetical protein [Clostridia bacterium]
MGLRPGSAKNKKVFSIHRPPSADAPYLYESRHGEIIRHFNETGNACHVLNTSGDVDLYFLLSDNDNEEIISSQEDFVLNTLKKQVELELYWDNKLKGVFSFRLLNPLDINNLRYLLESRSANMYYITRLDDQYVCAGVKTVLLPAFLCYDAIRLLEGKKALLLPDFSNNYVTDNLITEEILTKKAWGYYLDFTALLQRIGNQDDTEEIITRHFLDSITRLQKSKLASVHKDTLFFWIGRSITGHKDTPCEYYSTYISGRHLNGEPAKDYAHRIMEEAFREIPEFIGARWVSPIAEEAVPMAVVSDNQFYRIKLSEKFYTLSNDIFKENFLTDPAYTSFYQRIASTYATETVRPKIYNLTERLRR